MRHVCLDGLASLWSHLLGPPVPTAGLQLLCACEPSPPLKCSQQHLVPPLSLKGTESFLAGGRSGSGCSYSDWASGPHGPVPLYLPASSSPHPGEAE